MKKIMTKKKELWIIHGAASHSYINRLDCIDCINIEIEHLQELKKAGGKTKLIESLSKN